MNIRLDIEYDGEGYHGWQRQISAPSIQACIEDHLSDICGRRVVIYGAGRTDTGVHAAGQVANFHTEGPIPPERWCLALNTRLPPQIRILKSQAVPINFHAQRSALSKVYQYRILNRSFSSALNRRVYFWPQALRWDKMRESLGAFVGQKDFAAFQSGGSTIRSTIRTIYSFTAEPDLTYEGLHVLTIEGNGFLRQMVRNIVGTVMEVGQGLREPDQIESIFSSGERHFAGRAAPARGLFLMKVNYGLDGARD